MSKYKFHLINSNTKIIKRVKNDLWGFVLLTKKNKYKNLYSRLYDKRRKRFHYFLKKYERCHTTVFFSYNTKKHA